ncbi:response regulator transcription factor [Exiguobacterium artemiae]|uniref:response regulator transcription factor n=1 Tax=Exiguobacterium artemiae TaxID=340145 RepID=UPI00296568F2|nr:response regulator transcription factor [Exiguobacterium sibiricum]MDW2884682.1 response regulator transcription factor [Exiguobacterium sibiricum]
MKNRMIRLLIVDDHALIRNGLRLLIEKDSCLEVVAEAEEGGEAIKLAIQYQPDIILLDVTMPGGLDGFVTSRALQEEAPESKIILLTMHDEDAYVRKAIEQNIPGYLSKSSDISELSGAIKKVYSGQVYYQTSLSNQEIDQLLGRRQHKKKLSRRELEIVHLTALGYTNIEISEKLIISPKTVENHKARIMTKLNIKHKHELVRFALKNHLLD